jgi:uncharacterized RDD family membrane protein YckC
MEQILKNGLILWPSRKRRLACMLYESMLLFGVLFFAGYVFDTLTQSKHALYLRDIRQWWFFSVLGLYFVWFWCNGGQTLAMKTWHIRLVNKDGGPVSVLQSILRYFLCWIFNLTGIALIYSFFDKNGLFLQDRLAKTLLISTN